MSSSQDSPNRTLKAKKAAVNSTSVGKPGQSGPTTFFLKSEKEVSTSVERGRKMSRAATMGEGGSPQKAPSAGLPVDESSYGVQSLEDAISSSYTESNLSRTDSNTTDENAIPGAEPSTVLAGRKRKAGNPVHPRIAAAGQRIISSEHPSPYSAATGSPVSLRSSESPLRTHLRRGSTASSINLSQPLTPLKGSPHAASALPSTPRSGSPKSFRLSDEEVSVASDTGSQAVASSSGDEDEEEAVPAAMPQLVMPSIAMPARRPFTERGRRMGRLRVMVVGSKGVGKTSLIQSICRVCEDIVHVDPVSSGPTQRIQEIGASTKPYPQWRSDVETSQRLRRASTSEGALERNITFIDTPSLTEAGADTIRQHMQKSMARMLNMQQLSESEILGMLSGEGGAQVDLVLFLCSPRSPSEGQQCNDPERALFADMARWTNVVPLIGRSDIVNAEDLPEVKKQLRQDLGSTTCSSSFLHSSQGVNTETQPSTGHAEPFAVSSALEDDSETMDASVLMSSGYLQPLIPSELSYLVHQLLEPDNIVRLRHLSAHKFVLWRQENGTRVDLPRQTLLSLPQSAPSSPAITGTGSLLDEPSKVLVPHASSSYFRSASPTASDSSGPKYTLENITEPFRQVRLAKWAQDLRRSLDNERNRYKQMYANAPSEWASSAADSEKQVSDPKSSLTTTCPHQPQHRPAKGRLGGDLGVIDPRDPLGLLAFGQAFRRRGWFALQVAGGCGLVGAAFWWVVRNWVEVQELLGLGPARGTVSVVAVPIHATGQGREVGWLEEGMRGARQWEGWFREAVGAGK